MTNWLKLALAGLVLLSGCQTSGGVDNSFFFVKPTSTEQSLSADTKVCSEYATENGGNRGAMVAAGLLSGGLVGGIGNNSSMNEIEQVLFEECLYEKGYQQVGLPVKLAEEHVGDNGDVQAASAVLEVIRQGRLEEFLLGNKAKYAQDEALQQHYLQEYPDGLFAEELTETPEE